MRRVPGATSSGARGKGHVNEDEDGGRYSADLVAILEYLYQGCTKPNHSERQSMIRKYSALATMESNQIKIWFLNRRTRDKGKRVSTDLHEVNKQLLAANQLLGQENDHLEKVVRRLVSEKENMRPHKENMSNGLGESTVGPCSELIFAPMIKKPPDDPLLLASGFRILSLDSVTGKINGQAQQTMNVALGSAGPSSLSTGSCSVLIVAFQFPFESHLLDYVANMAQKYVGNVLSYVRNVGNTMTPSRSIPHVEPDLISGSPTTATLATYICQSYRLWFGEELLRLDALSGEVALEHLLYHKDAIFCWSLKPVQICLFANQASYNMLDASLVTLHDVDPDQIFGHSLQEGLSTVMKQGYAILTGGICMSLEGNSVRYD